jgi:predicted transcriptional regulator/DNA-binding XRE family transcriptional regulator
MVSPADRKLYLGARVRVLRRELGLTQTHMAEALGVSPSYLNHIERNQRPLTTQMLLRLAEAFDLDIRDFVSGVHDASSSDLREIFADSLVQDIGIPKHEIDEVAENHPNVVEAVVRLYRALSDLREKPDRLEDAGASGAKAASPLAWLRNVLDARHNHFAEIDGAAESLSISLGAGPEALHAGMVHRLKEAHRIEVRIETEAFLPGVLRHYDFHRRRLRLHEALPPASRLFAIAYQTAMQELADVIGTALGKAEPPDTQATVLGRIALTSYAAAALIMPYAAFHAAAESSRYDVDFLTVRFGVSYEQAAHRLTTLGQPGARGVPFFMLKQDVAGNVSKRFAAEAMPLARFGGGCARWRVHRAFRQLGETIVDLVETPDEKRYLTFARANPRPLGGQPQMIVLGCDAKHAKRIAYTENLPTSSAVTPIGPACHLCERADCSDRALPPISRTLSLHQYKRAASPYPFLPI